MKSHHNSFSSVRRALIAATVVLATGSVAALAQTADRGSNASTPSTGSNYDTTNSSSNANSGMSSGTMSSNGSDMSTSSNSESSSTNNDGKVSWSDRRFLNKVSESNQQEIKIAQLAADHASSPDVKNFAQHMIEDHQKLASDLQSLASSHNITLKGENENKESREYKKLAQASGTDFDQQFVKLVVNDHKKDVKEFQDRANDAKDLDVKTFAQNALPTLQHHLQMAQDLQNSIVPTGRTGGPSGQGPSTSTTSMNYSGSTATSPNTGNGMSTSSMGAASSSNSTSTGSGK